MKNKNGFTLVEVLTVVVLLGVVLLIAVPSITKLMDKNKKRAFAEDALRFIALAEEVYTTNTDIEKGGSDSCVVIYLNYLNTDQLTISPFGTNYLKDESYVYIEQNDNYSVKLISKINDKYYTTFDTTDNKQRVERSRLEEYKEDCINSVDSVDSVDSVEVLSEICEVKGGKNE